MKHNLTNKTHRRGAILPMVALMLPIVILLTAIAVNMAYMELTRTELQISVDAAARAGGRTYANTGDVNQAKAMARTLASRNTVAGEPLLLDDVDFEFGVSIRPATTSRYTFDTSPTDFNALKVTGRRTTGSSGGPVQLFLPSILGISKFEPTQQAISTQVELDITVVVDRSGSMAYADNENSNTFAMPAASPGGWQFGDPVPTPSRWDDAEAALNAFLNVLDQTPQTELVSLVTYGDRSSMDVPLTGDYLQIADGMDVYTQSFNEGLTNIGGGIDEGVNSLTTNALARPWASKIVVVLTDGIHNTGTNPNSAAQRAVNAGATVYTVTFSNEANQGRMRRVAQIGNGAHYHAQDRLQLIEAFEEIARSLPTLIVD